MLKIAKTFSKILYICIMKVISKMDFVHDGDRFKRGTTHEVEATTEILKFIEIGYLVEVKELKVEKKTKEFKIEKETK